MGHRASLLVQLCLPQVMIWQGLALEHIRSWQQLQDVQSMGRPLGIAVHSAATCQRP